MGEMDDKEKSVTSKGLRVKLHPFRHQVSGSTLIFNFDRKTLCKPLLPREYHFYKSLPETLKEYTAQYKGSIEVQCEEDREGTVTFFGVVSAETASALNLQRNSISHTNDTAEVHPSYVDFISDYDEIRLTRSGSIEMDEESLESYDKPESKLATGRRLNKRLTAHLAESSGLHTRFILLENLVSMFEHPSVLDLKMGTRTHGDDDTDEKKKSKKRKCQVSTSEILGVRLHGMQKYDVSNNKFETLTKFEGLQLSAEEFKTALGRFLDDGKQLRQELVLPICRRLQGFHECLSQQNTFRFYSSSLLIIYDGGATGRSINNNSVQVKAIDFAHTTHESSPYCTNNTGRTGPDNGYLLGLQTLIDTFQAMLDK